LGNEVLLLNVMSLLFYLFYLLKFVISWWDVTVSLHESIWIWTSPLISSRVHYHPWTYQLVAQHLLIHVSHHCVQPTHTNHCLQRYRLVLPKRRQAKMVRAKQLPITWIQITQGSMKVGWIWEICIKFKVILTSNFSIWEILYFT